MAAKNSSIVNVSTERGTAPVIWTVISIAIVFILTCLDSSVVSAGYADSSHKGVTISKISCTFL